MSRISLHIFCLLLAISLAPVVRGDQGNEIIIYEGVQLASDKTIVVTDTQDTPMSEARVDEMSSDWKTVLKTQKTNGTGEFHLGRSPNGVLHYLQISVPNFNQLRVRVRFDKKNGKKLKFQLPVGT
jgi:hypothetical protein